MSSTATTSTTTGTLLSTASTATTANPAALIGEFIGVEEDGKDSKDEDVTRVHKALAEMMTVWSEKGLDSLDSFLTDEDIRLASTARAPLGVTVVKWQMVLKRLDHGRAEMEESLAFMVSAGLIAQRTIDLNEDGLDETKALQMSTLKAKAKHDLKSSRADFETTAKLLAKAVECKAAIRGRLQAEHVLPINLSEEDAAKGSSLCLVM